MFVFILKMAKHSDILNFFNKTRDKRVCCCMCWIYITWCGSTANMSCLIKNKYKERIIYLFILYTVWPRNNT